MEDPSEEEEQDFGTFEIEKIVGYRKRKGRDEYLVHWLGYDEEDETWEPAKNLGNVKNLIEEFYNRKILENKEKIKKQFYEQVQLIPKFKKCEKMIGFGTLVYGDDAFTPKDSKEEKSEVKPLSKNKKKKIIDILSMPVIYKPSTSLSENVSQKIKRNSKRRKKK